MLHFWPHVGKAKICFWDVAGYFSFWKFVYNFFKKTAAYQTHFGITNVGSKLHPFCSTVFDFDNLQLEHAVQYHPKVSKSCRTEMVYFWLNVGTNFNIKPILDKKFQKPKKHFQNSSKFQALKNTRVLLLHSPLTTV